MRVLLNKHPFQAGIEPYLKEFEQMSGIKLITEVYPEDQFRAKVLVELLGEIYANHADTVQIVFLKDLFELLDKVADRCRDAGNAKCIGDFFCRLRAFLQAHISFNFIHRMHIQPLREPSILLLNSRLSYDIIQHLLRKFCCCANFRFKRFIVFK